jgi:hypothetical protein
VKLPAAVQAAPPPLVLFHLKLVAKISLAVGALSVLVLLVVLTVITGPTGQSYGAIIRAHSLTRQHLGAAMLVAGLLLVALTGLITWLIVFYSSFRVAGPLYRFTQNLKLVRGGDVDAPRATRRGDVFARQAQHIDQAIAGVRAQHASLHAGIAALAAALAAGDAVQYADALARLNDIDAKVQL